MFKGNELKGEIMEVNFIHSYKIRYTQQEGARATVIGNKQLMMRGGPQ